MSEKLTDEELIQIREFLDSVINLSDNFYVCVEKMETETAWYSERMQKHFGIECETSDTMINEVSKFVYHADLDEYYTVMNGRRQEIETDDILNLRMENASGERHLYSIRTDVIHDDNGKALYFVVMLKDENVLPEIDAMTNLYAAPKYAKDLEMHIKDKRKIAILTIAIERLNNLNIIYSAKYTNEILKNLALLFIYMMDRTKAVYRLEGAKFSFILKDCDRDGLIAFEHAVRQTVKNQVFVDGQHVGLKMVSGGILLDHYEGDIDVIRSQLSYSLGHSKEQHAGHLVIFNDEVRTQSSVDLNLMKVIYQSVRNGCDGFYLEYQPIVSAVDGKVEGAEALVRWKKEPYGKVPPGMFIEWMENDSAMYDLGNYILRKALIDSKEVLKIIPDFFVNVNVSARQMDRVEFCEDVMKILEETGYPADHLCLELTERCKNLPLHIIEEEVIYFKERGIRMAMDDYGTGSASSSIVLQVPMSEIKLDMSFIKNIMDEPKNQAMVDSIVGFANKCGMKTCLEGVETKELEDYLKRYHASWFQGYYYSKPLESQAFYQFCKDDIEKIKKGE